MLMIIKREIGEKGQVVIPKDIREYLGLDIGSNIVFEVKDNQVAIKKEQDPEEFLKDFNDEELIDVLEVIHAIGDFKKINLEKLRTDKAKKRGAFKNKIILESTE